MAPVRPIAGFHSLPPPLSLNKAGAAVFHPAAFASRTHLWIVAVA